MFCEIILYDTVLVDKFALSLSLSLSLSLFTTVQWSLYSGKKIEHGVYEWFGIHNDIEEKQYICYQIKIKENAR